MDGIHDLGGVEGFGPIDAETDEPVFRADWERRAFGVTIGTFVLGVSNGGQFRHSIERMDPVHYLTSRYYEHWITGVATRLAESGMVPADELDERSGGRFPRSRPEASSGVETSPSRASTFSLGDRVRVRGVSTRGHTRCPRYVRGRAGTVVRVDPSFSFPDLEAHSTERREEPVYCVAFAGSELWGDGAERSTVHVDLWHSYLEPA